MTDWPEKASQVEASRVKADREIIHAIYGRTCSFAAKVKFLQLLHLITDLLFVVVVVVVVTSPRAKFPFFSRAVLANQTGILKNESVNPVQANKKCKTGYSN